MKRIFFLLLLLSAFMLMAQDSAPSMTIDQTSFDAGIVMKGTVVEHDFLVKNSGTAVLKILSAKPG
ncbi:MAG TPA: hypothetical protein PK014_04885 [Thermoanaerobaculia bacterium]|nr:hypothetical protein [Thermoanaerobaculia bacterium]HUM29515.1 hypothetical protein [Thermoanaerobaculia bacterium]HXK67898.1 hypothetical protein [Thermoanaerobaculia bacterium]